jgi:hypothetical protein
MVHCERKLITLNDHQRMARLPEGGVGFLAKEELRESTTPG